MSKKTYTIDATGKRLGRLAVEIAVLLRGKNEPDFSFNVDSGNKVTVVNTSRISFNPKKARLKKYWRHSGYLGGIKEVVYEDLFKKDPNKVLRGAVYGMLPDNKLRAKAIKRLTLFKENQSDKS